MTLDPQVRAHIAAGTPPPIPLTGKLRVARRLAGLLGLLIVFVPLHYLWRLFRAPSPWPRTFLGATARLAGARVSRRGTPRGTDVFYTSNHVSWIDILASAGQSGTAFVAKQQIRDAPVIGWLSTLNRTVFIDRDNRLGVIDQIEKLRTALDRNWAVTVFPEGTTTDGRSLLPFKTPMLRVLEPPPEGVMVQPVLLDYGAVAEEIGWVGAETGVQNAMRVLARKGSFALTVHYLEPFAPAEFPGRKAIAAEAHRRIEAALLKTLGKPLRPFAYL